MNFKIIMFILIIGILPIYTYLYITKKEIKGFKSIMLSIIPPVMGFVLSLLIIRLTKQNINNIFLMISTLTSIIINYMMFHNAFNLKKIPISILVILIYFISSLTQLIPILIFNLDLNNTSITTDTLLTCYSDLLLIIALVVIYRKDLKRDLIDLKNNFSKIFETSFKYWILGFFGMIFSNLLIAAFFQNATPGNENAVQSMIDSTPFLTFICAAIMAPFIEEVCFRKTFTDVIKNKWLCALISGLVFGLLHVIFSYEALIDFVYVLPYSVLGFFFTLTVKETNNIFSSTMMHMLHNGFIVLISIFAGMIIL